MKIGEFQEKYGGLSNQALAEIFGCSPAAVHHWSKGLRRCPVLVERWLEMLDLTAAGDPDKLRETMGKLVAESDIQREPDKRNSLDHFEPAVSNAEEADKLLRADQVFLQDVFDAIQDGVSVLDPEMRILRLNRTMEKWYAHAAPFAGKKCFEVFHNQTQPCRICPVQKILQTGQPAMDVVPKTDADGHCGWQELYAFPLHDATGRMTGVVEYVRDITAKKEAEGRLRKAEEKLREAQKHESLVVMAGGIAHNFNNLLMVILGNLELAMADKTMVPGTHDLLLDVRNAGRRAAELSRQMLVFSGRSFTALKQLDLNTGILNLQDAFTKAIAPQTKIVYNLDYSLPPIELNQDEVRQVLSHLVTNAIEAIGDKPGMITITTGSRNLGLHDFHDLFIEENLAAGQYVFIRVDDTGCGMNENIRQRMFDPFFSTKFMGRGLGLAEVLGIIRHHGGTIQVLSQPAVGSSVIVYLPMPAALTAESPAGSEPVAIAGTEPETKLRDTILIVDDEEDIRLLFQRILEANRYQVILAEEGGQALDLLEKNRDRIKAVLLDIKMPGLSGDRILADMQKLSPAIPVIIVSGYHEEEVAALFIKAKPAAYLQKPFKINALLNVLQNVMQSRSASTSQE